MRIRRDPKQIAALLVRRERLGLTWSELGEESGVPLTTLYKWNRRFKERGGQGKRRRRFIAVQVKEAQRPGGEPLEITLRSGDRIRVTPGFDADHLRRVVIALESRC